jgi:hypothetical protein
LPFLDQIASHCVLERAQGPHQSIAMQNMEQVGFESSGASLTTNFLTCHVNEGEKHMGPM